jgi:thymidylate synthase (FAD)
MRIALACITQPMPVIDDSHTDIVEVTMSPEEYIIYCARVSSSDRVNNETAPKLLKYLIDKKHWSPFEMVSVGIEIKTSRAIAQQLLRHRSFSFQEFSQRYAEVTDMEPVQLRYQAKNNRQSSTEEVTNAQLEAKALDAINYCRNIYADLIENGVAKECARMVLPLTTQTTLVMHGTFRSWIHFFEQRCSEHAQLEIQQIAYLAREMIGLEFPWTAEALTWNETRQRK